MVSESRRHYHSPMRDNQAETTRQNILNAAEQLFSEKGYTEASIAAIAAKAGVAQQTVYATFGSKSGLVIGIFARMSEDKDINARYAKVQKAGDPALILQAISLFASELYTNKNLLFERLIEALGSLPDLKDMILRQRLKERELMRMPILDLRASGVLRPELSDDEALDILWTLTSASIYLHLVKQVSWTKEKYASWLADLLRRELTTLPDHA